MEARTFYRELGAIIAERRRAKKLTQEGLAKAVGLSRAGLANIETGRQGIHVHQLIEFANSLGVTSLETLLPANFWISDTGDAPSKISTTGSRLSDAEKEQVSRIFDLIGEQE